MRSIFYVSRATSELEGNAGIDLIVRRAKSFNHDKNVTGVLLYHAGLFMQLVEGERDVIEDLFYKKIEKDRRHQDVVVLFDQDVPTRLCPDWQMGYHPMTELDLRIVNKILDWSRLQVSKETSFEDLRELVGFVHTVMDRKAAS